MHTDAQADRCYDICRLSDDLVSVKDQHMIGSVNTLWPGDSIKTVSVDGRSAVPHGQRDWAFTPSGGGDMEIQKAYLKYNLVTSSVCLRHN